MTVSGTNLQSRRQQTIRKVSNTDRSKQSPPKLDTTSQHSQQEFSIIKTLSDGEFSKIFLSRPDLSTNKKCSMDQPLVLKACDKTLTNSEDFYAEMDLNYFLSPHPNIITSYNVSFVWDNFLIYPQEYAPCGDLWKFIKKNGGPLPESQVKLVAQQLSCALEFIHSMNLVHRDVVPENVLIFKNDLSLIKLSDFGSMVSTKSLVTKNSEPEQGSNSPTTLTGSRPRKNGNGCGKLAYLPPEICAIIPQEKYHCYPSVDVWQVGILLFVCLSGGSAPWRCADVLKDSGFNHYCDWLKRRYIKTPSPFQPFSSRLIRLFKRMLEPKATKRCSIEEVTKYLKDDWLGSCSRSSMSSLPAIKGLEKSPSNTNGFQFVRSNSECQTMSMKRKTNMSVKRKSERVRGGKNKDCKIETSFTIRCSFDCKTTGSWQGSQKS